MNPEVIVPVTLFLTIAAMSIGIPLARGYVRRMDAMGKWPQLPSALAGRLERMEQSLDAVAVEVERISEGQRFTTKLLSGNGRGRDQMLAAPAESAPADHTI